jgi:hypothetical protein
MDSHFPDKGFKYHLTYWVILQQQQPIYIYMKDNFHESKQLRYLQSQAVHVYQCFDNLIGNHSQKAWRRV